VELELAMKDRADGEERAERSSPWGGGHCKTLRHEEKRPAQN
jgi:hypothetical protein